MFKHFRDIGWVLALCLGMAATFGCGGKKTPEAKTPGDQGPAQPTGPDYQTFAPLPRATNVAEVPFLLGADGEDHTPCFKAVEGLAPAEGGHETKSLIEENGSAVNKAIRAWFVEDLAPAGLSEALASKWEIEVEDISVKEVPSDQIRFVDDPQCIQPSTGWLSEDIHAVMMMIGARTFKFTTTVPIDHNLQEEMIQAVGMENMVLESEALFVYEPATDSDGQPIKNQEGAPLFKAPDGRFIEEKEVPPAEQRTMKEWTLKAENAVYFAFRELSDEMWRKESKKDQCDVYLVWGDITPRPPECEEFTESKFVATQTEDGDVAITITTGDQNMGETLGYGEAKMIQVNDRIILWVSPKKIEEGVLLRLNSLVLAPQGITMSKKSSAESYVPARSEPPPEEEKPKKEKKKSKKKGAKTDQDALDDFLND